MDIRSVSTSVVHTLLPGIPVFLLDRDRRRDLTPRALRLVKNSSHEARLLSSTDLNRPPTRGKSATRSESITGGSPAVHCIRVYRLSYAFTDG